MVVVSVHVQGLLPMVVVSVHVQGLLPVVVVFVHAQEDIDEDSEEHKHCGNEQGYRIKPLQISFPIIQTNTNL